MNSMSISVTWKKYTRYSNKLYCVSSVCHIYYVSMCFSYSRQKMWRMK